jgi:hypothetical protein
METTQTKLKPFHIIIIVVMLIFAAVFYLNKDKIINPNAAYEELYSTFLQADGTIVSSEQGSRIGTKKYTIQFRDQNDSLITVVENNWQTMPLKTGDHVTMYYNPQNPSQATPESRWRDNGKVEKRQDNLKFQNYFFKKV